MRHLGYITAIALTAALTPTVTAQKTTETGVGGGGSPHVRTEWTIDGARLSIEYGRPFLKGRPEADMMPPGKPWRTGADAATILTTDKPLKFGTLSVPAGSYTINTQPGAEWQLILGKLGDQSPQPPGIPYKPELEIGRAPMKTGKTKAPVEQVTISIDDTPAGGTLRIEWGTTSASIPFTVG
jgi:Protein of unknown function (DUF2911)